MLDFPRLIHNSWPIFHTQQLTFLFFFFFINLCILKCDERGCTTHYPHALLHHKRNRRKSCRIFLLSPYRPFQIEIGKSTDACLFLQAAYCQASPHRDKFRCSGQAEFPGSWCEIVNINLLRRQYSLHRCAWNFSSDSNRIVKETINISNRSNEKGIGAISQGQCYPWWITLG